MATKKRKEFTINFLIKLDTSIQIEATTFEEALEKARTKGVRDMIEFDSEYSDGSIKVIGVYDYSEIIDS